MKLKTCWVAKQYKVGWRLGFAVGNAPVKYIPKVVFVRESDVNNALNRSCVFIHLKKIK
jgi:hypothetical protein